MHIRQYTGSRTTWEMMQITNRYLGMLYPYLSIRTNYGFMMQCGELCLWAKLLPEVNTKECAQSLYRNVTSIKLREALWWMIGLCLQASLTNCKRSNCCK